MRNTRPVPATGSPAGAGRSRTVQAALAGVRASLRAVVVACVTVLTAAAALAAPVPAFAAGATPVWAAHPATLTAGHPFVLKLTRPVKEACSLTITSPVTGSSSTHRTWGYAASNGVVEFGITPPKTVARGRWTFTAGCRPTASSPISRAVTTLTVSAVAGGRAFLTGTGGPTVYVPTGTGTTSPQSQPAAHDGKGGDPGDDYPYKNVAQDSQFDPWGEYVRECTSFVAWALHSRNHYDMPFYANANNWGPQAQARGIAVDHNPTVGSVAWSTAGYYGHVAWVLSVSGSNVTIEEYNRYGNGTYDSRTVTAGAFTGYIHFADLPTAPPPQPDPAPQPQPAPQPTPTPQPQPTSTTYSETPGGVTHTWTDYSSAGGAQGPSASTGQTLQVACKVTGFKVTDGNTWWYLLASSPWNSSYYASADAFYNNGATSGSLYNTPYVDPNVPDCSAGTGSGTSSAGSSTPPPSQPPLQPQPAPVTETTGGVTHTWTNYSNAGGTQGPSIASNASVVVSCRLQGFQVADGNTWWYRIASSPWNDAYYASADAFYNNGQTSGSLNGTPYVDPNVPTC